MIDQLIYLEIDARALVMKNFLHFLSGFIALVMFVRFFNDFFHKPPREYQFFHAIMATLIPMIDKMSHDKIITPEGYIWARNFITKVKGGLMITVFFMEGTATDFYIAWFFFITTSIGYIYFWMNPYRNPETKQKPEENSVSPEEARVRTIIDKVKKEAYAHKFGEAYRVVGIITILSFMWMVALVMISPKLPVGILKINVEGEFKAGAMSLASIVMILYNAVSWVEFS